MHSKINDVKKNMYLLKNLIQRDLKVKYRRSILGIIWSVLNPLLMMVVITTVFSKLYDRNVENFHIYYLTGITIYNFVSESTSLALNSILSASSLIKKVYIPKYIFPLEKCIFSFINLMFSMVAVIIVMLISNVNFNWTMILFPISIFYALIFSIGLSLILSAFTVFFRDIMHIYGVFLTAWVYITPIIYPDTKINEIGGILAFTMKFNPMYYFVTYFRNVLMYGNIPSLNDNLICIAISLSSLVLGLFIFKKLENKFVLHL